MPLAWVWGVRVWRSSTPNCPSIGRAAGAATHWLWVQRVWVWGPVTNATARALPSWLCALWGRHKGARGGCLLPRCGASEVGRSPTPDRPSFRRAAGARYPLAVGAGGLGVETPTNFTVCALPSWLCVLWGQHEGAPAGVPLAWMWGVRGLGALPRPTARPSGVRPGPATHWLWVPGVWAWGPVTNPAARALPSWLCALWGRHEGAWGGGASCLAVGRPGWALMHAGLPVLRACGRGPLPTCCGCGGCGRGEPSPTPQGRLLPAGFARSGAGTRAPGGGASCLGVGRLGLGALPAPGFAYLSGL